MEYIRSWQPSSNTPSNASNAEVNCDASGRFFVGHHELVMGH